MNTIKDVAAQAGVSTATVSRVINNSPRVKSATREKVLLAVAACGYTPNELARSFRSERSGLILVIIPDISNVYYARVIKGVEACAHELGYSVILCDTSENSAKEQEYLKLLDSKLVGGLILMTMGHTSEDINALQEKCPVVQCCEYAEHTSAPRVAIDNFLAAQEAVRHLINRGHRRIGMLSSKANYYSARLREKGYFSALAAAGIPEDPALLCRGDYGHVSGIRLTRHLLKLPEPPTAVFCISDSLAIGALKAARKFNLAVPAQFAAVGFDNTVLASLYDPMVTTISQPKYELGYRAMELLARRMDGEQNVEDLTLEYELIIRESTIV